MATITSAASGPWSAGSTWVGGSAPANNDTVVIAAGHAVEFDVDLSGWADGVNGLTITSHATTPGMLYAKHSAAGNYYLKLKTGTAIVGTNAATLGRLLANSDGVWGNTGALPFDRKFIIDLGAAGYIDLTYLEARLRCTEPTNKYVLVTGHTVGSAVITTTTNVTADPQWVAGAAVVLADEGPADYDQQRTTLASVDSATQITLGAVVDSAQYNGAAKVWLMTRNVAIRSATVTGTFQMIRNGVNCVLGCEIRSTAGTGTTFYGYGVIYGSGHIISGTVSGCNNGVTYGSGHTISGTVSGCNNGVYLGSGHIISGTVSGCNSGVGYGSGHTISGTVSGCNSGVGYGSIIFAGATLSTNTRDLYNCITQGAASLNSTVQNGAYKHVTVPMAECRYTALVMPLGGVAGALGCWTQGGFAKSAAYASGTHGTPAVTPTLVHEQAFEDSDRICYVELPYTAQKDHQVTVIFHGKLTGTAAFTALPSIGIYDPAKPWQDAAEALDVETMASNTDWQTLTVTYTPTTDMPLNIRVQGIGGNAGGTGTEKLYWFIEGVEAVPTTLATAVAAIEARLPASPAAVGDAMTLTTAERTAIKDAVEAGASMTALTTRLTATRAGYLDALNTGVPVASVATDAITAAALKADAVTEIQNGLATAAALATVDGKADTLTSRLTATRAGYLDALNTGVPVVSASVTAIAEAVRDLATSGLAALKTLIDAIKAKTDNLPSDPADQSEIATLIDALPTAAENADAVWDEAVSDHVTAGTAGRFLQRVYRYFFNKRTHTNSAVTVYADDGTTADATMVVSGDTTTVTKAAPS